MPPARELVDAGAAVALATDFNPGSAFCESLPLVCSLAATQLKLSPAEALAACTVNAAHVLGRADRKGRIAPGYDADLVLLDAPDWRYLAYHLAGDHRGSGVVGGGASLVLDADPKQRRRQAKDRRHEYEYVYVDDEGQEVEVEEDEPEQRRRPRPLRRRPASGRTQVAEAGREVRRAQAARGTRGRAAVLAKASSAAAAIFAPIMLVVVYLLKPKNATRREHHRPARRAAPLLPAVQLLHGQR